MTNKELVLNMLAELSTTEISKANNPQTISEHKKIAEQGGEIAKNARKELEAKTGQKVVTSAKASDYLLLEEAKVKNIER